MKVDVQLNKETKTEFRSTPARLTVPIWFGFLGFMAYRPL